MRAISITALFLLVLSPRCAWAHAFLDHADPKVGSTVSPAPVVVKIWFTEAVEPAFSAIEVHDASGNQVDKKDSHIDDKDPTLLIVSVPSLSAGTYKVTWHVVATDTHHTQGDFKFSVK
jgi:copper resistance protein C